jgi:hypothetical protein
MVKIAISFLLVLFVFGCATDRSNKKTEILQEPKGVVSPNSPNKPKEEAEASVVIVDEPIKNAPPQQFSRLSVPRIGIIFSGGGAKAWAHVGVIKEIEKAKWPIQSVAGVEWGSAIAAIYAHKFSSNEVEWEMSKVKDFSSVEETSQLLFDKQSVNELKAPFVCASLNISKQIIYLLNRGQLSKLMPFCLAHPPLSSPYGQSVAELSDIASLAQHLRATGANKIVLINVLAQNTKRSFTADYLTSDNILWVKSAAIMAKKIQGVDDVITINLDDYGIKDLDKKREIIAKGAELGYSEIKKLSFKYGL